MAMAARSQELRDLKNEVFERNNLISRLRAEMSAMQEQLLMLEKPPMRAMGEILSTSVFKLIEAGINVSAITELGGWYLRWKPPAIRNTRIATGKVAE